YSTQIPYEVKSDVYGCCIKLLTGSRPVKERWGESFYFISQSIRSHGRLYVVNDSEEAQNKLYYDPQSKTAFLINVAYYGTIKSLALSVAGDILEDEHNIYSVHGACLDVRGRGLCMLGESGAGKTTHTYGLLAHSDVRVVSDDWFYARLYGPDVLAYSSEKNFYIRADLAQIWSAFRTLIDQADFDKEGRAVVDIRLAIGKGRILPLTTLTAMIILKRERSDETIVRALTASEALDRLERNQFYNPHLLVRNQFKQHLRTAFFASLLQAVPAYEVNTTESPENTQAQIRTIAGL
ncbi:MAG: HPr kinase/phosphorylase, partial [Halobacteriota archaeon]